MTSSPADDDGVRRSTRKRSPPKSLFKQADSLNVLTEALTKKRKAAPSSTKPKSKTSSTKSLTPPARVIDDDSDSTSYATALQNSESPAATTATRVSLPSPEEARLPPKIPEFTGTNQERLEACLKALTTSREFVHQFDEKDSSHFALKLKAVEKFLSAVVESRGRHGTKRSDPAALYVCGVPGIGKTSGVRFCCDKVVNGERKASVVHINSGHMKSAVSFRKEFGAALGIKTKNPKIETILGRIKDGNQHDNLLIVVVDEIDLLLSGSTGDIDVKATKGCEKVVKDMLDWANDPELCFVLIGISNSSGNAMYSRLQQLGEVRSKLCSHILPRICLSHHPCSSRTRLHSSHTTRVTFGKSLRQRLGPQS